MAKAVTLKNSNDEEVYPVTDISLVNGEVPASRIADSAITTAKLDDGAVAPAKMDYSKMFFYKACPQVNPFNIPTAWTRVTPSGWSLTFTAEVGAYYKVEITTSYLAWMGSASSEFDLHLGYTGASLYASNSSTMTGTYSNGVSIGRTCGGIIQATSTSVTVNAAVAAGATGNYARIDNGYILVTRIG